MQMYESNDGDLTKIMFKANKSKRSERWNRSTPAGLLLSIASCWSGAGSKKDPSAAEEVPWLPWKNT
jgi:hypothetical protein